MQFLDDNNITLTKEVECPMPSRHWHVMSKKDRPLNTEEVKQFRSLVGSLGFYSVSLRYDISRSVCRVHQRPGMRSATRTQPSCNCQFREKSTFQSETRFAPLLTTSKRFAFSESHSDNFFSDALVWGVN